MNPLVEYKFFNPSPEKNTTSAISVWWQNTKDLRRKNIRLGELQLFQSDEQHAVKVIIHYMKNNIWYQDNTIFYYPTIECRDRFLYEVNERFENPDKYP